MSLAAIDAAIFAALTALGHAGTPSTGRPFSLVARHTGGWTRDTIQHVAGQYPVALLRANGANYTLGADTLLGDLEARAPEAWSVLVALEDPRGADEATQGADGVPGLLTLIDLVLGAVNALPCGAERNARAAGWRWVPELAREGVLSAAEVLFIVDRIPPSVTLAAPGEPLEEIDGVLGPPGAIDNPAHIELT